MADLAEIERELFAARERLAVLRENRRDTGRLAEPAADPPDDARVWASAREGRLSEVRILDPRVMRLGPGEVADLLVTAVNDALNGASGTPAQEDAGVDLDLIAQQLRDVREEALGTLHRTMSTLQDAVARLRQEAHVTMPSEIPDFHQLFANTEQHLAAVRGDETRSDDEEILRGEGRSDVRGYVYAMINAAGVESLTIDAQAMRKQPSELAGFVLSAVNAALQDLRDQQRERVEKAGAERVQAVQALQDRSVAEMRAFCDTMTRLMGSIGPLS